MRRSVLLCLLLLLPAVAGAAAPAAPAAAAEVPVQEIQRYVSVYRAIKQAYVEPLSDRELMRSALRGLLGDLDPHSAYLEKEDAAALQEMASGAYDGIGVEIEQRPDRSLVVVAPIDGTPAARAGLRAGDIIIAIDGKPLEADHADAASLQLRGKAGSKVVLTLSREGEPAPRDVAIVRETIRVTSVSSRLLEPGYGYLRLSAFQKDTGPELRRHLVELARRSGGPLRGIVLDLRSNPGGLLTAAIEAADAFLDGGVVVTTRGRLAFANAEYRANPGDASAGAALAVLVDAGTASAAEVLAGALHDHKRAVLLGSRTFGKGSVQTVVPLDNGDSVKLTTARYYTPNGRSIQAAGIRPDVVLRGSAARGLREQDLPGHLGGDDESADGYARGEVIEGEEAITQALARLKRDDQARVAARRGA